MKKLIIIFIVFTMLLTGSYAQYTKDKFIIAWEVGIPSNDFLSNTSYSGGKIEYQHMIKPDLSVGLAASWNSFSEYVPKTTYQKADGTGAITSDAVKEVYSLPLALNVKYYFKAGKKILPYAGIGLGAQYSAQTIYFNIYSIEDDTWGFLARPEIGLVYPFNEHSGLLLSGAYNYAANKSDFFKTDNLSHFALSLGFVFSQ